MKKLINWLVLASLLIALLSACSSSPQPIGCGSIIKVSFNGQDVYSREGTAWYDEGRKGFSEPVSFLKINALLKENTANFLSSLGIVGLSGNLFKPLGGYDANGTGVVTWGTNGVSTCPSEKFIYNMTLEVEYNSQTCQNQGCLGPTVLTKDYGQEVSFTYQSNMNKVGDGASLSYSFSKEKYNKMLLAALSGSNIPAVILDIKERQFLTDVEYGKALIDSIQNSSSIKVMYFNFPANDFAGEKMITNMIPKVLGLTSADYPGYMAVLKGRLTTLESAMTSISTRGGTMSTRKFLLGSTTSSSGGSMNFSETTTISEVLDGSIFFVK